MFQVGEILTSRVLMMHNDVKRIALFLELYHLQEVCLNVV